MRSELPMTYFADLSPCTYFGATEGTLLAVGWLDGTRHYAKGVAPRKVFDALFNRALEPWQPMFAMGWHDCELCSYSRGPKTLTVNNTTVSMGISNVFIPGGDAAYVAPSLILHYMDSHGYEPPAAFQRAVL